MPLFDIRYAIKMDMSAINIEAAVTLTLLAGYATAVVITWPLRYADTPLLRYYG